MAWVFIADPTTRGINLVLTRELLPRPLSTLRGMGWFLPKGPQR